jgi:hypothetical protein
LGCSSGETRSFRARYKADLALHDRSQGFSSELAKLGLAGVAVLGFLLAHFPDERLNRILNDSGLRFLLVASVIAFGLSVGIALLQRFYANSAMFHHLQVIKFISLEDQKAKPEIRENMGKRERKFLVTHVLLKVTAGLLVLAAALISAAFVRMLFVLA